MHAADQVLTAAEMRAAEDSLVEAGISVDVLMQRAGQGAADWVWRVGMGRPVTVLCGPGNNGGDGYVIAETLRARGLSVTVVAPRAPGTDAARTAAEAWRGETLSHPPRTKGAVFVDCLFGSGLSRPLAKDDSQMIREMADAHDFLVAVDLPSGVTTDEGALLGPVRHYDLTLALGAWKPAHFLMPAMEHMGMRKCVNIGVGSAAGSGFVFPRPRFSAPPTAAHKYSRGLVGIVAGVMPGAALLAAQAAMRGGAGYVKFLSSGEECAGPAALVVDRRPLAEALEDKRWSALLVGPGLGRDSAARERLAAVLDRRVPTVIDADALHLLDDDLLEGIDRTRLLVTPHEGELAALCTSFGVDVQRKLGRARTLAEVSGLTVLAKGPDNLLASPDGRIAYFPPAPSWLSTAGTGDVLGGIAASRLASGSDPFTAGGETVWLHAEAARCAGAAFTADDLSFAVSTAYAHFL
jgi:hydroxyethylthiazole kinase-like uncharacterized protein yjeF